MALAGPAVISLTEEMSCLVGDSFVWTTSVLHKVSNSRVGEIEA